MLGRYECTEDILGRAMVLNEILFTHLTDLDHHLRCAGVSETKIDSLKTLSIKIASLYDLYLDEVDEIFCARKRN